MGSGNCASLISEQVSQRETIGVFHSSVEQSKMMTLDSLWRKKLKICTQAEDAAGRQKTYFSAMSTLTEIQLLPWNHYT